MRTFGTSNNMGSGMVWSIGVIEDINDPEKLGRVRVRIHGWHSESKQDIPTTSLPWAIVMQPTTSAGISGIGTSPTNLVCGTWCVIFFSDGNFAQKPIVMGTLAGIPDNAPITTIGFNDPNGEYPRADMTSESDVNRLARNENIEKTIVQSKIDNIDIEIAIANSNDTWSEPITKYDAIYPNNNVKETKSGHVVEYDDTTNVERIHHYHKSGTFEEIFPNGSIVKKIIKDKYEIIYGDDDIYIKGNVNVKIDGNANILVVGNVEEEVSGDVNRVINGNLTENVTGNILQTVGGSISRNASGSISDNAATINHN